MSTEGKAGVGSGRGEWGEKKTIEERVWVCRKDPWRVGEGVEETGRGRLVGGSQLEHRFQIEEPLGSCWSWAVRV